MRAPWRLAPLVLLCLAAGAVGAHAQSASPPTRGALYQDGPDGRYLLGGAWLLRLDPRNQGTRQRFQRQTQTAGWSPVRIPNAWNAHDFTPASMAGSIAWYRRDFRLPAGAGGSDWVVRFESVSYRAKVWLNGRPIGSHTGAYLPWELRLAGLRRGGVNRLVVRVDNRRGPGDFPPSRFTRLGTPTGGWWNDGGILREVYLRRIDRVDLTAVQVRPELPCTRCAATVAYRATLRNASSSTQRVRVSARFGARAAALGTATIPPGGFRTLTRRVSIGHPRLWSPASPYLYRARVEVRAGGRTVAGWSLHSGVRSIKVVGGHLYVNGQPTHFRGVGIHEDSPDLGSALDNAHRDRMIGQTRQLGATVIRAHYPLHPELLEQADRQGILVWSEIPVYGIRDEFLRLPRVQRQALAQLETEITADQNHPSVMLWSIANELSPKPGFTQRAYITRAVRLAKSLDPTRPVAIAVAGYPSAGCQRAAYSPLDVIGVNEYFGWYPGPSGQLADRDGLSPYLDSVRACYRRQALVVTEFGAEANRDGPLEEKGTYAFQSDWVRFQLGVLATKSWLSGALYWTLQEFRIRPDWAGGNPRPTPPLHQKGLIAFDGRLKPAFADVQRSYAATRQYGG